MSKRKLEILAVGLEISIFQILKEKIDTNEYHVTFVEEISFSYREAERNKIDLVVISTQIIGRAGLDLFLHLREQNPLIAGIIIISSDGRELVYEAMNCGFNGVFEIPVDPENLLEKISEVAAAIELREENSRLKTLIPIYKCVEGFLYARDAETIFDRLFDAVESEIGAPSASVMMMNEKTGCLHVVFSRNVRQAEAVRVKPGEGISGWVFETGNHLILNRKTQHETPFAKLLKRSEISASISFPMIRRAETVGVINISRTDVDSEYSEADIELLSILVNFANMALENVGYIKEREEYVRVKTMMEQYVSPEVADFLIQKTDEPMSIGGFENLTVMFADIRNYTMLVQHVPLEKLREYLNQFFDMFVNEIYRNQGTLDKFMGDAALVVFGAPVKLENQWKSAVQTSLAIAGKFTDLKNKWAAIFPCFKKVNLGIGISSGRMFIGNIGASQRLDYTVLGKDVNIAQRLASETGGGEILVTNSVRKHINNLYEFKSLGKIELRGLAEPISVFSILPQQGQAKDK